MIPMMVTIRQKVKMTAQTNLTMQQEMVVLLRVSVVTEYTDNGIDHSNLILLNHHGLTLNHHGLTFLLSTPHSSPGDL